MPMDANEFALAETHEPHLFVVRKQQRQASKQGETPDALTLPLYETLTSQLDCVYCSPADIHLGSPRVSGNAV